MENLNKNQIILLTLLVSFVTSIATGIVTVTLMDQAPAGVTQTVNRVVERTIERVVPGEPVERVIVKEVPVEVTQDELVRKVIYESTPALVRLSTREGAALGSGFVVSDDGLVLTIASLLPQLREGERYRVALRSGDVLDGRVTKFSTESDLALIKLDPVMLATTKIKLLAAATVATSTPPTGGWAPLALYEGEITLGQSVVALGSPDAGPLNVAFGIIAAVDRVFDSAHPTALLATNVANTLNQGGPVLSIRGQLLGINKALGQAIDVGTIKQFLAQ